MASYLKLFLCLVMLSSALIGGILIKDHLSSSLSVARNYLDVPLINPDTSRFTAGISHVHTKLLYTKTHPTQVVNPVTDGNISTNTVQYEFSRIDLHRQFAFSTDSPIDVLVFMHMQKTGGTTFGKNLVTNLDVRNPCQCDTDAVKLRCPCYSSDHKKQWLLSRYSTGWMCGLHADYTEWSECLRDNKADDIEGFHRARRYLWLTILREPRERYVSEWLHVNRGATWYSSTLRCNGRSPDVKELPFCYDGDSWEGVTLKEFIECPYNLAHNRQTRMLANLSLVNCYDGKNFDNQIRNQILLNSAKENLTKMAFFGLKSFPNETQSLFERTFKVNFIKPISKIRPRTVHSTSEYMESLNQETLKLIDSRNELDVELYNYARQLFFKRLQYVEQTRLA